MSNKAVWRVRAGEFIDTSDVNGGSEAEAWARSRVKGFDCESGRRRKGKIDVHR